MLGSDRMAQRIWIALAVLALPGLVPLTKMAKRPLKYTHHSLSYIFSDKYFTLTVYQ